MFKYVKILKTFVVLFKGGPQLPTLEQADIRVSGNYTYLQQYY